MNFGNVQERNARMVEFFIQGDTTGKIAKIFKMTRQNVEKILKREMKDQYLKEINKRNNERNLQRSARANEIIETFKKNLSVKETAKKFKISESAVTQQIKNAPEYSRIKERKKKCSEEKRKCKINSEKNEEMSLMAGLKAQNEVSVRMMSRKGKLLNDSIIKLCINEYSIKKGKRMIFNEGEAGKRPFDLPEYFRIS